MYLQKFQNIYLQNTCDPESFRELQLCNTLAKFLGNGKRYQTEPKWIEVSAQCFRDAGTPQVFMLSGLNLNSCCVMSTSTECLCPLIDGEKDNMGKGEVC